MSQGRSMELLTTRTIRRTAVARDYHILRVTQTRLLCGPALEPPVLPHETFTTRIFARPLLLQQMARHKAATTWFHYDPVGNQDYMTDPRGTGPGDPQYTTTTDYD